MKQEECNNNGTISCAEITVKEEDLGFFVKQFKEKLVDSFFKYSYTSFMTSQTI